MDKSTCIHCEHYMPHYSLDQRMLFRVYCGHCSCGRAKRRRPDTPACVHFKQGLPKEEAFVRKEYLSKTLLQHMMNLELLPKISEEMHDIL